MNIEAAFTTVGRANKAQLANKPESPLYALVNTRSREYEVETEMTFEPCNCVRMYSRADLFIYFIIMRSEQNVSKSFFNLFLLVQNPTAEDQRM